MQVIKNIKALQQFLAAKRGLHNTIGFVPTMGALHLGHLSLVNRAAEEQDICVVSIFVNPTQFNDPEDLNQYPRMLDDDCEKLKSTACDVVFAPGEKEIYPDGKSDQQIFDFAYLDHVYEGRHRPGHFKGVGQVVSRLLHIVQPDALYLGNKDYQQLLVIKHLVKRYLKLPVQVIGCPIVREKDGLAMSSRNMLLNSKQRKDAVAIYNTLKLIRDKAESLNPDQLVRMAYQNLEQVESILSVEYFALVDALSLHPVLSWNDPVKVRAITAVQMDHVRLIDNMEIR